MRQAGLALAVCVLLATVSAASVEDPLGGCLAQLEQRGPESGCGICFFAAIDAGRAQSNAVLERLDSLIEEYPDQPWLRFEAARIRLDFESLCPVDAFRRLADEYRDKGQLGCAHTSLTTLARLLNDEHCVEGGGDEARSVLEEAREVAQRAGTEELLVRTEVLQLQFTIREGRDVHDSYSRLRTVYADLDGGEKCKGRDVVEGAWSPTLCRNLLSTLATASSNLGLIQESRCHLERLITFLEARERRFDLAAPYANQADSLVASWFRSSFKLTEGCGALGWPSKASIVKAYEEALERAEESGLEGFQFEAHLRLGRLQPGVEGARHLERATVLAEKPGDASMKLRLDAYLATALATSAARPDREQARRLMDQVTEVRHETERGLAPLFHWWERLWVEWHVSRDQAVPVGLAILDYVEAVRALQGSPLAGAEISQGWTEIYLWLSGHLLRSHEDGGDREDLDTAFAVVERMRGRWLREAVSGCTPLVPGDEELAELRERLLPRRALSLEQRRQRPLACPDSVFSAEPVSLLTLEEGVPNDTALLSFQLAPWEGIYGDPAGGSWLVVTTAGQTKAYRLPDAHELDRRVLDYVNFFDWQGGVAAGWQRLSGALGRSSNARRRRGAAAAVAAALEEDLLGAALADLPSTVDHLVLVPDGVLHRVPFASLGPVGGPLLAERFLLSYAPSASLWSTWHEASRAPITRSAVVFANPAFDKDALQLSSIRGKDLGKLRYAEAESDAIEHYFAGAGEYLSGAAAKESTLVELSAGPFAVLHFAAHAIEEGSRDADSFVVLAPGDGEDGLLLADEIPEKLDLGGKLVVLAACHSGAGRLLSGEGVLSLARPFLEAGAATVVASLWPLVDRQAPRFFERFYAHLASGATVDAALALAQRDRKEAGDRDYHWAGLLVIGDGDWRLPPGSSPAGPPFRWRTLIWLALGASVGWLTVARVRRMRGSSLGT